MQPLPQTPGNLTQAASTLSELILGHNITTYRDDELREAVRNAAIVESAHGMRLGKERPGAKIDLLAALSFACLTAVREGARGEPGIITFWRHKAQRANRPEAVGSQPLTPGGALRREQEARVAEADGGELYQRYLRAYAEATGEGLCLHCGRFIEPGTVKTELVGRGCYHKSCAIERRQRGLPV